jgi:chemotaxis protein methyltransferase CheR
MTDAISLDFIRKYVYDKAAIVLDSDKDYLVESRLLPVARKLKVEGIAGLVKVLRGRPSREVETTVVEALTTNETYFFRDQHPFELLTQKLIPELAERRRATRTLKIWCGASSTGQEPYSILMSIFDALPDAGSWDIQFVATDINLTVLEKARSGVYKQHEVNRGLPAASLIRYFDRAGNDWVVKEKLRKCVDFQILNLAEHWPFREEFDLVFMRNVLIYFDVDMKKHILSRVRRLLKDDGVLFLGGAETTVNLDDRYSSVRDGRSVYYRRAA